MKEHNAQTRKVQRRILVLPLVLLAASMAVNVYLYSEAIKISRASESLYIYGGGTSITKFIQGFMGEVRVEISRGLLFGPGHKFNVSVVVSLWVPHVGSHSYSFAFKLYEHKLDGEYPDMPITEKTVLVHKDKDAMYISVDSGNLTATASSTLGIYIYKVVMQGFELENYEVEFPIWVERSGEMVGPIV